MDSTYEQGLGVLKARLVGLWFSLLLPPCPPPRGVHALQRRELRGHDCQDHVRTRVPGLGLADAARARLPPRQVSPRGEARCSWLGHGVFTAAEMCLSREQRANLTSPRLPLTLPTLGGCTEQRPQRSDVQGLRREPSWPMGVRTESGGTQICSLGSPSAPLSSPPPSSLSRQWNSRLPDPGPVDGGP